MTIRPRPKPLPPRPVPRPAPLAVVATAPGGLQPPSAPSVPGAPPSSSSPASSPSTASPVLHPPASASAPPKGSTTVPASPLALCCPDVAAFEGSTGARSTYFGFDDKTNLVANAGDEYWIPPTDGKTLPGNKETRDGARWVSVGVGRQTQVTIKFGGSFTAACLPNCSFEVDPAAVATVVTSSVTSSGVAFQIKGAQAGEASLKVICNGKLRGYFHIWCVQPAVIDVDVASIVTPHSSAVTYVAADLEDYINEVFRQSLISVNLNDAGAISVKPTASGYMNGVTKADFAHFAEIDQLARASSSKLTARYRLYYYVATAGHSGGLGVAPVGAPGAGWAFFDYDLLGSYNTMAHEFGHLLNLSHPIDDSDGDEFPAFQLATLSGNVLADDPWNLMGYNGAVSARGPNRKPLRYRQWKKLNRR